MRKLIIAALAIGTFTACEPSPAGPAAVVPVDAPDDGEQPPVEDQPVPAPVAPDPEVEEEPLPPCGAGTFGPACTYPGIPYRQEVECQEEALATLGPGASGVLNDDGECIMSLPGTPYYGE
jgi:hypothetical protein